MTNIVGSIRFFFTITGVLSLAHMSQYEKHRLIGGTLWSLPLSSGSKGGYLFFWHPRYLEDELGCIGEDEVLDIFQLRPGNQGGER